jgi:hypothetical protein
VRRMANDFNIGEGRGSLRDRLPAIEPPTELASRVTATLEARRLVRRDRSPWVSRLAYIAAGILLGLTLRGALGTTSGRPPAAATAGQYVLLLYGDPPDDTGAVHVAREREYGRWASELTGGVRWVAGHELGDVVDVLGVRAENTLAAHDRLAGYFVIDAPSRERAAEVARSCPHLKYGGRVVVMAVAG